MLVYELWLNLNKIFLFQIIYFSERIDNKKIKFSLYGLSYLDDEYFLSVSCIFISLLLLHIYNVYLKNIY